MENVVPLRGWCTQLRTRIVQPFFRASSAVTQRPRPVPVSPFGVTKGSKIRDELLRDAGPVVGYGEPCCAASGSP
jgi:hypothetical protein